MRKISTANKLLNEVKTHGRRSTLYVVIFTAGLLGVLFISPFLRGLYFEKELLAIMIAIAVSFACGMGELFFIRNEKFFSHPLDWAMLGLVITYLMSLLNAVHIHQALLSLLTVAAFFMVYWMAGRSTMNEDDFNRLLLVAYLSGIGLAIVGLGAAVGLLNIPAAYEDGHIRSAIQYHNTLAIYLAGFSFVGMALSLKSSRRISRLAYAGGNLLLVMVMVGAISRGTWLLYPWGLVLFIFLLGKRKRGEALLNWVIFFPYGLIAGLGFLNNVSYGRNISALGFILAGLIMAVFMQWLADLNKQDVKITTSNKKNWLRGWPQLVGIGLVLLFGMLYMMLSAQGSTTPFVPRQISAKVEKTSLQDNSINDRLTFYRDSIKIASDYPLIGAGGGGWAALYHSYAERLYWSREVHSYYLQTLVEAGSIGLLALLTLAVLFIKLLFDSRQQNRCGELDHSTLWGGAAAVIIIGMHAAFDADFSLPSTGILFYTLVGAIKGIIVNEAQASSGFKKKKVNNKITANSRDLVSPTLGLILALLMFAGAGSIYRASSLGETGALALEAREVERASTHYHKAAGLDPWCASYQINLAKIEAVKADQNRDSGAHQAAKDYAARAAELEPWNGNVHRALIDIYAVLHEGDLAMAEAEALVRANPLLEQSYEILAANNMEAAWYFLRSGKSKQADMYFARVMDIREELPAGAGRPGAGLNLMAGQASVCLGKIEQGQKLLNQAAKGRNKEDANARLWLAVAAASKGDYAAANNYLQQLSTQDKTAPAQYQTIIRLLGPNFLKSLKMNNGAPVQP
ncbi:MAG: O-antigen ligase family protein [Syntrophomonas sp.]